MLAMPVLVICGSHIYMHLELRLKRRDFTGQDGAPAVFQSPGSGERPRHSKQRHW